MARFNLPGQEQGKRITRIGVQSVKKGATFVIRNKLFNFNSQDEPDVITQSMLGTPVYDNLTIGDIEDLTKNVFINLTGDEITYSPIIINDVLLEVNQTKNIIKTSIQGRNGTIKEYVSDGDFIISVTGRITNDNVKNNLIYPEEEMSKLRLIQSIPDAIPVTSNFLQAYGIFNAVIEDFRTPQIQGFLNEQFFEMTLSSDEEIDLENVQT